MNESNLLNPTEVLSDPISWDFAIKVDYARKFPLDGSILLFDIHRNYIDILESLNIELVRDFFIKEITYESLQSKISEVIAGMVVDTSRLSRIVVDKVKASLRNESLPGKENTFDLADSEPVGDLYAFYDPEKRRQLNEHNPDLISILRNVHWGGVTPQDQALDISNGSHKTKDGRIRIFTADDIEKLIQEGLTILRG